MGLETSATSIASFNTAWPLGTDLRSTADDHLRFIKATIKNQFTGLAGIAAYSAESITATAARMNDVFVNACMLNDGNDYSASTTQNFNGGIVDNARLRSYTETFVSKGSVATGLSATLDFSVANNFAMTIATASLTLSFSNWPAAGIKGTISLEATQDATGSRTLLFPAAVKWAAGVTPPIASSAGAVSSYAFTTRDGGTTVYGYQIGYNQS